MTEPAPSYDELDVAWTYGLVVGRTEPDEELLATMRVAFRRYVEQRSAQLGQAVRLVGSIAWDTPPPRALPREVRRQVLAHAPADLRVPGGRLRRDVTLIRAWQHTDYRASP